MSSDSESVPALARAVALLQEKWALLVVARLMEGPSGFNELSRRVCGICPTMLSQRLSLLEDAGLVSKTIHSTMPPRTSYELTEAGKALKPVLDALETWAAGHLGPKAACPILDGNN
ncbi:MAG: helix-turn-helix transcriptional regulator [Fimbriimonas ginsengisoli]|uniref:Helix-turn-helix transcriptional regulator n=1 Tax=Fimbriimonas ginsengisoli TaxID=1005039 RepID=A0A931LVV6_FIMGI|nr:helix-turn-helix transcriptional regulator [Fimbriimonas ginsengisoli]